MIFNNMTEISNFLSILLTDFNEKILLLFHFNILVINEKNLNYLNMNKSLFYNEYSAILIFLLIAIALSIIIVTLSYFLAIQNPETEKLSSYECGFEPYEDARHTFDVKFYLVAILFIVFDIETMFLLPWSISLGQLNSIAFWAMIDFIIELGIGFVYVWCIGALDWD